VHRDIGACRVPEQDAGSHDTSPGIQSLLGYIVEDVLIIIIEGLRTIVAIQNQVMETAWIAQKCIIKKKHGKWKFFNIQQLLKGILKVLPHKERGVNSTFEGEATLVFNPLLFVHFNSSQKHCTHC